MALLVLEPGMLTTVQDLGRPGYGVLGVSACGAADAVSLRIGNRLVGNPEDSPALEMTLTGGAFQTDRAAVVAISGSDFGGSIDRWAAVELRAGDVVRLGPTRAGARCTLCVRGGVVVPRVLGSASTHLASGLGGFEGRPLRKGDRLEVGPDPGRPRHRLRAPRAAVEEVIFRRTLRVTPGPQADWFRSESIALLHRAPYEVTEEADRMGLRLRGPALERSRHGELLTEGVCLGAVQVPESGEPIVIFVDQRTTGGYPKVANVITADAAALGQLRPRDRIRFESVSLDEARARLLAQERALADALEEA